MKKKTCGCGCGCVTDVRRKPVFAVRTQHPRPFIRLSISSHRHVDLLAGLEALLVEAEALDLVEVEPGLGRVHVVGGHAQDGLVRLVLDRVKCQRRLPRDHLPSRSSVGGWVGC